MKLFIFLFAISFGALQLLAQNDLILPRDIKPSYDNGIRNIDGTRGANYWQNHGDYDIDVTYNPTTRTVSGSETIVYYNESPDSLHQIIMGLYQEVLSKNTKRYRSLNIDTLKDETVIISSLEINGKSINLEEKTKKKDTNLIISLDTPLSPKSSMEIKVIWHYQMLKGFHLRTGDYGNGVVFVGYFYPRVAVYDDIDGWDRKSYNILHEFYSDFNQYDVNITVPADYIVSATGRLQNSNEVLSPKYEKRYQTALQSPKVYSIIDTTDLLQGGITKRGEQLTWKYHAPISPDFSFSVCKNVLWDGSNVALKSKNVFVDAVYVPASKDFYEVAGIAADAVRFLSEEFPGVDYPYTDMTIVNGWAAMEFPMMVNDPSVSDKEVLYQLTVHEVGHTYFPFYIGTNERKYAWMDEAWANIFPVFYLESRKIKNDYIHHKLDRYYRVAGTEDEVPIITLTNYLEVYPVYRHATYSKPSYALLLLRDFIGHEAFAKRLKNYFKNWGFKHPIPYDFFGAFNPKNEEKVNWFYQEVYFKTTYADLTLNFDGEHFSVINTGGLPVGFDVVFTLKNGEEKTFTYSPFIWRAKNKINLEHPPGTTKIQLINQWDLDVNKADNIWEK